MSLKLVNLGLTRHLDLITGKTTGPPSYTMKLFKNNITPGAADTAGTYTECDFSGYSAGQAIAGWGSASISGGGALANATTLTWTHNGGGTANDIYGYYVVDGAGTLIWAERDPAAPFHISALGQTYSVAPQLTDKSEF